MKQKTKSNNRMFKIVLFHAIFAVAAIIVVSWNALTIFLSTHWASSAQFALVAGLFGILYFVIIKVAVQPAKSDK